MAVKAGPSRVLVNVSTDPSRRAMAPDIGFGRRSGANAGTIGGTDTMKKLGNRIRKLDKRTGSVDITN